MSAENTTHTKEELLEWVKTSLRELGFEHDYDIDSITLDTPFDGADNAIGCDSLDILTIAMDLEKVTGKNESFDVEVINTVGDLVNFFATK